MKRSPPRVAGRRFSKGTNEGEEVRIPGRDVIVAMEKIMVPTNCTQPAWKGRERAYVVRSWCMVGR